MLNWIRFGVLFACLSPLYATAALVELDWVEGSGDRLLTRDTVNGLDWLDVTVTTRRSYLDITTGRGGWVDAGFRYASVEELRGLFGSSGITEGSSAYRGEFDATYSLLSSIGITYQANVGAQFESWAILGDPSYYQGHTNQRIYGHIMASINGTTSALAEYSNISPTSTDNLIGSFLVREVTAVPVPAAIWLFGSGFIALMSIIRRKN